MRAATLETVRPNASFRRAHGASPAGLHVEPSAPECVQLHPKMLAETPHEEIHPPKLLTGDDLLAMGYRQGPVFGQILGTLEDAQLEGKVETKEEAASSYGVNSSRRVRSEEETGSADSEDKACGGGSHVIANPFNNNEDIVALPGQVSGPCYNV